MNLLGAIGKPMAATGLNNVLGDVLGEKALIHDEWKSSPESISYWSTSA